MAGIANATPGWLLVAAGGAAGSLARYGVGVAFGAREGAAFPWATLAVNIAGCLAIGWIAASVERRELQLLVMTGVLGGFTTFSAFGLETLQILRGGQGIVALAYVAASLLGGVGATAAGWFVGSR